MSFADIRRFGIEQGGMLAFATLAVYAWLAPANIVHGDNAEFASLAALGGVAHPSGYPLYVLWLRAWSWLPLNPAHAASVATAIIGALQVLTLHAACRAWGARPFAASCAVMLYATAPLSMRVHTEAEVFAMNGWMVAFVLWLSADRGPLRGYRRIFALTFVAGLALANHLTCVLVAPIGLLGVVRGFREAGAPLRSAAVGAAGLLLGLAPYAYLFVAPDSPPSWTTIDDLAALLRHVTRADYGGAGAFSPRPGEAAPVANLLALGRSVGRSYVWLPSLLVFVALPYLVRRPIGESRVAWAMLSGSLLLAGPLLVMQFNIQPVQVGRYVVERFHLLSVLVFCIPVAVTLHWIGEHAVSKRWLVRARAYRYVLLAASFLASATLSLPWIARVHSPAVERGLANMLRTLPENAIVIGSTDEFHYGTIYLQAVRGERRDVAIITTPQVGLARYRECVRGSTGITIEKPQGQTKLSVDIATQALATGRPVFIDPYQATIAATFPIYPHGILFRVLPQGTPLPPIEEVFAINKELFSQFQLDYAFPTTEDQLATQFHDHYARVWRIIAKALAQAGRPDEYAFAVDMANALAPREP